MSSTEFAEWKFFYNRIQSFGPFHQDTVSGLQTAHIVSCLAENAPREISKYMPQYEEHEEENSADKIMASMSLMRANGQRGK